MWHEAPWLTVDRVMTYSRHCQTISWTIAIISWILRNKFQKNFNLNSFLFSLKKIRSTYPQNRGHLFRPKCVNSIIFNSLWLSYAIRRSDLGQHWIRLWLVVWRHQPISRISIDLSSVRSCAIYQKAIALDMLMKMVSKLHLKIVLIKSKPHPRGIMSQCKKNEGS